MPTEKCLPGEVYGKPEGETKYRCFPPAATNTTNYSDPALNLSGNQPWKIDKDGRYYKTSASTNRGAKYYLDKSDPSGETTTWDEAEAMTTEDWNKMQPVEEVQAVQNFQTVQPIGGTSLPPREDPLPFPNGIDSLPEETKPKKTKTDNTKKTGAVRTDQ